MMVQAGDYLGFSDFSGTPTIAARSEEDAFELPHMSKGSTNALPFVSLGISTKFSVGAGYSTYENC